MTQPTQTATLGVRPELFPLSPDFAGSSDAPPQDPQTHSSPQIISRIIQEFGGEQAVQNRLGRNTLNELRSLSRETDAELFYEALNHFGQRLERGERMGEAGLVYSAVASAGIGTVQQQAQARLALFNGNGSFGEQLEMAGRGFARQALSPTGILTMAGAQVAGGLTTFRVLAGLRRFPVTTLLGRPLVARTIAGGASTVVETGAFMGIHHGFSELLGLPQVHASLSHEFWSTLLTIAPLKFTSFASHSAINRLHGSSIFAQAVPTGFLQRALPSASMFGGIYLGLEAQSFFDLRPRSSTGNTLFEAFHTFFHFQVAGRMMQDYLGPGFQRFNQDLHFRTEQLRQARAGRPSMGESIFGMGNQEVAVTAEGVPIRVGERTSAQGQFNLAEALPPELNGTPGTPGGAPPTGLGGGTQPPRPNPLSAKGSQHVERLIGSYPTRDPASRVGSSAEGRQRARSRGLDQRALAFLRMAGNELRDLPEARQAFFKHVRNILTLAEEHAELIDPILQYRPHRDFSRVHQLRGQFDEALSQLTPNSGRHFGEYILFSERIRSLQTAEDYGKLTEANLIDLGLEPKAREAIFRNAHAFTLEEVRSLVEHPLLRDAPDAEAGPTHRLMRAYEKFDQFLTELAPRLEKIQDEANQLRGKLKQSTNAEEQFEIENQIFKLAEGVGQNYWSAASRVGAAMEHYLNDPVRANVLLIEIARRSSLVRALQAVNPHLLADFIRSRLPILEENFREFLGAVEEMDLVDNRGIPARLLFGALRVFGLDPHAPEVVRGRLDEATIDLIQSIPHEFWDFARPEATLLAHAQEAGQNFFRQRHQVSQKIREVTRELEETNDRFWANNDSKLPGLEVEDIQFQIQHAGAILEKVRSAMGEETFDKRFGVRYREIKGSVEQILETYSDPKRRGNNSRRANRRLEVALEKATELRDLAREALRNAYRTLSRAQRRGLPSSDFQELSALMMPYVDKVDSSGFWTRPLENLSLAFRHLPPTAVELLKLKLSMRRQESMSVADWLYLRYNRARTRSTNSEFVVDSHVDKQVAAGPATLDIKHASWHDFLEGGLLSGIATLLKGRATDRHALRIAAKKGLGKKIPFVGEAVDMFTEPISDSAPEYDGSVTNLARAMAFGDFPGNRLGPRSSAVFSELTMPVTGMISPFAWDPFPGTSTIVEPPQGARSFAIADRAMAFTGQLQDLVITTVLNSYRLWPKPDYPLPLRKGPTTTVSELWPMLALTDGEKSLLRHNRPPPSRANWLRTLWLLEATNPDYEKPVKSIDKMFRPFERAQDPVLEAELRENFPDLVERILYPETREALCQHMVELGQRLEAELEPRLSAVRFDKDSWGLLRLKAWDTDDPQLKQELTELLGLRRMQRVLQARLKTLQGIDRKVARGQPLSLTERKLVEKMAYALSQGENTSGTDHILEQLNYYFAIQDIGGNLRPRLLQSQEAYYNFVRDWNERRKDPNNPEYHQIHISEDPRYEEIWQDYRISYETTMNLYGVTPSRYNGELFPDMIYRREGNTLVLEPRHWQPNKGFSRLKLWQFFISDTLAGMVPVARRLSEFDPTPQLYLTLHGRGWGWKAVARMNGRLRIENTENIREVANNTMLIAPTHDSIVEFPILPGVALDYGLKAFFVADQKFFDPFRVVWKTLKLGPLKFRLPIPKMPFGLIRAMLGEMEQYGHMSINRENREEALEAMALSGRFIRDTGRSLIAYPGATRNPGMEDAEGNRYEGPIYASRGGVGNTMEAGEINVLPMGLINGGIMAPKDWKKAYFTEGAALGLDYIMRFGEPIYYSRIVPANPKPRGPALRNAVIANLDGQYGELTGRPIGPPAPSKAKKTKKEK